MVSIKHAFQSTKTDDSAAAADGQVTPSRWNADLDTSMATARILGRNTAGTGAIEELTAAIVKTMLALNNVDNTADIDKAVSTAVQAALNAKLALAGGTMTGNLILAGDPSANLQAATKQYVDNAVVSLARKFDTVRAATTANVVISTALNNGDVIDGVTLADGDLVLVKNQTTASQNGVYVVSASPARSIYFDAWTEIVGSFLTVQEGTTNADTGWLCTSDKGGTIGTTAINYTKANFTGEMLAANNLGDVANAVTAFGNIKQAATTTVTGVVELATDAESLAGTSTAVIPSVKQVADKIAASAGGGKTLITSTTVATGVSSVDFTATAAFDGTYKEIELEFWDVVGNAAGGVYFYQRRVSDSVWAATFVNMYENITSSGVSSSLVSNGYVGDFSGDSVEKYGNGKIRLSLAGGTQFRTGEGYWRGGGASFNAATKSFFRPTTAINGLRIFIQSTTVVGGEFRLWGIK